MKKKKLIILGSESSIAIEFIKLIDENTYDEIFLFSRNINNIYSKKFYTNFKINFLNYEEVVQKLNDIISNDEFCYEIIFFYGKLKLKNNKYFVAELIQINGLSQIHILENILFQNKNIFKTLVVTSVAGDLIRDKNYIYSLSKNLLSNYIKFLKNYKKINIIDLKIGPTITKMTKDEKKNFLFSKSSLVAQKIYQVLKYKNNEIVYIPFFWKYILFILRLLPNFVIKFMKI